MIHIFFFCSWMAVSILLSFRTFYLQRKMEKYISAKHPEMAVAFRWSKGEWHPWSLSARMVREIIRKEGSNDRQLICLRAKVRRATAYTLLWIVVWPFIILAFILLQNK